MRCKHPPGVHIFNRIKQVAKRIANIRFARDNRGTAMYRIMIVEDDEVIARAVQQSLVSWGMDAFCVQDFSGVLAEFAVKNPQLVLMDIHLPFFNGFHWCQEIRKVSKVPVIFLSSASNTQSRMEGYPALFTSRRTFSSSSLP